MSFCSRHEIMAVSLIVCLAIASTCAYHLPQSLLVQPPILRGSQRLLPRASAPVIATATNDDQAATEKRLRAQRLALQAERAALEAEQLELKVQELKLASQLERQQDVTAAEANAESAAQQTSPLVAAATVAATDALDAPGEAFVPGGAKDSAPQGAFNLSSILSGGDGSDGSSPPPPPLTYGSIAQVVGMSGKDEAALQLTDAQIAAARERVFDLEAFYVQRADQTFIGTIFRGNLRANASTAYARVAANAAAEPALKGVRFLLLEDPIALTLQDLQDGDERRPVFLALPVEVTTLRTGPGRYVLSLIALFASTITSLGFALSTYLLADGGKMLDQMEQGDTAPLEMAIPIAAGIASLQLAHEFAHFLAARKHDLRIGVPLPLPSLQLGLFGCITRLRSFPASRQVSPCLRSFPLRPPYSPSERDLGTAYPTHRQAHTTYCLRALV